MLHLEEGLANSDGRVEAGASVVVEYYEAPEDQGNNHGDVDTILGWARVRPLKHQDDQDEDESAKSLREKGL